MKRNERRSALDQVRVWRAPRITGLELAVKSSPVGLEFPPAPLFDYRFVLNGHGKATTRFGSRTFRLDDVRGRVFLQHPDEMFSGSFTGPRGASGACLGLSERLMAQLQGDPGGDASWRFSRMVVPDRENARLATLIRVALDALQRPVTVLEQEARLVALVEEAMRSCSDAAGARGWRPQPVRSERPAVAAVKGRFHERPGDDCSMRDIAELTGLNPRYVIRVFKQQVGITPHRYLTAVRVARAKDRLSAGQDIPSVAYGLGFSDQAHFTRVFKEHVRVTPGAFRRLSAPER